MLIRWEYNDSERGRLKAGVEYTVEFKVKKLKGTLDKVYAGMFLNWPPNYTFTESFTDSDLSADGWTTLKFSACIANQNLQPSDPDYYTTGRHLFINFIASEGLVVLIDDLRVYATDDPEETNMFLSPYLETKDNVPYVGGTDLPGTFDKHRSYTVSPVTEKVDTSVKYVPANIYDWKIEYSDAEKTKLIQSIWSTKHEAFPSVYNYNNVESRYALRPRISKLGEGVNGSYALVLGDKTIPTTEKYEVGFGYAETSTLLPNTEYTFSVKLRREGTVNYVRVGVDEHLNKSGVCYSLDLVDTELSDEWLEYTWKYTTTDEPNVTWNALMISYLSYSGAKIYVDDVNFWRSDDADKMSLFGNGDFEYIDKGITATKPVLSKDMPENEVAKMTSVYGNKARNGTKNVAKVVSTNDVHKGAEGTAVLAFGFEDTSSDIYYGVTLSATQPGKTYNISCWVKVVGDVELAAIGMADSYWRAHFYKPGYSFNQYEQGEWTKIEFTWTDPGDRFTTVSYRRFFIRFKGAAGTGLLVDDVRITNQVDLGVDAPNIFDDGSFSVIKKNYSGLVVDDNYIYKKEENQ